jgi:hypothetical protein
MDAATLLPVLALVVGLIGLAVLAMSVGVIFRRPCLRGSCGGPSVTGPDGQKLSCEGCPNRKRREATGA